MNQWRQSPDFAAVADIAANAIHRATLHERTQNDAATLAQAYDTTIEGWSHALDLRDQETEGHTLRVTEIAVRLARAMGIAEQDLIHVRRGALLHDIGKLELPSPRLSRREIILQLVAELGRRDWGHTRTRALWN